MAKISWWLSAEQPDFVILAFLSYPTIGEGYCPAILSIFCYHDWLIRKINDGDWLRYVEGIKNSKYIDHKI